MRVKGGPKGGPKGSREEAQLSCEDFRSRLVLCSVVVERERPRENRKRAYASSRNSCPSCEGFCWFACRHARGIVERERMNE